MLAGAAVVGRIMKANAAPLMHPGCGRLNPRNRGDRCCKGPRHNDCYDHAHLGGIEFDHCPFSTAPHQSAFCCDLASDQRVKRLFLRGVFTGNGHHGVAARDIPGPSVILLKPDATKLAQLAQRAAHRTCTAHHVVERDGRLVLRLFDRTGHAAGDEHEPRVSRQAYAPSDV